MKIPCLLQLAAIFIFMGGVTVAPAQAEKEPGSEPSIEKDGWERHPFKKVGDIQLNVWIKTPEGHKASDSTPAMVFYYGGGWKGRNIAHFQGQGNHLVSRGMVVVLADYRAASKYGGTPFDCTEDAKSAMRWVRAHAEEFGINPKMIAAGGGSAGGHLAAATATVPGLNAETDDLDVSSVPNALVLFNPVYDNGPKGYGHDRVGDRYKEISPMHNISETTPPTIVFLGSQDKLIPVSTAEAYEAKMEAAGVRCDTHIYEGRGHGFFNPGRDGNADYIDTVKKMDEFLVSLGYLKGEAGEIVIPKK